MYFYLGIIGQKNKKETHHENANHPGVGSVHYQPLE